MKAFKVYKPYKLGLVNVKTMRILVICLMLFSFGVNAQEKKKEKIIGEWELVYKEHDLYLLNNGHRNNFHWKDTLVNKVIYHFKDKKYVEIVIKGYDYYREDSFKRSEVLKYKIKKNNLLILKKKKWEGGNLDFRFSFINEDCFYFLDYKDEVTQEIINSKYVFKKVGRIPSFEDSLNGEWLINVDSLGVLKLDTLHFARPFFFDTIRKKDTIDESYYTGRYQIEKLIIFFDIFDSYSNCQIQRISGYEESNLVNQDLNCYGFDFSTDRTTKFGFKINNKIKLEEGVIKIQIGLKRMSLSDVYMAEYASFKILKLTEKEMVLLRVR